MAGSTPELGPERKRVSGNPPRIERDVAPVSTTRAEARRSTSRDEIASLLVGALRRHPGRKARELASELHQPKGDLNSVLYRRRDLFASVGPQPPDWFLQHGKARKLSVL